MTYRARWRSDPELLDRPARPLEFDPFRAEDQVGQAFLDLARCARWGTGDDRCILASLHLGPCQDAKGNTTLTLAAQILGRKA
jgi:hypothetical protein